MTNFDHDGRGDQDPRPPGDDPRAVPPSDPWLGAASTAPSVPGFPFPVAAPVPDDPVVRPEGVRRRSLLWLPLTIIVVLACVCGAVLLRSGRVEAPPDVAGPPARPSPGAGQVESRPAHDLLVTYEVSSDGPDDVGSIEYTDQDGEIIRRGGVALPWRVTFRQNGQRHPLVLIAQRKKGATGPVTCSITLGDKVLSETTQTGRFAAPQCSA